MQSWGAGAGNAPHLFCNSSQFISLQWLPRHSTRAGCSPCQPEFGLGSHGKGRGAQSSVM